MDECKSCIISPEGKCSVQSPVNRCEFCHCLEGKLYPDQCFNCRQMGDPEEFITSDSQHSPIHRKEKMDQQYLTCLLMPIII